MWLGAKMKSYGLCASTVGIGDLDSCNNAAKVFQAECCICARAAVLPIQKCYHRSMSKKEF
jgi:hypothetical protein